MKTQSKSKTIARLHVAVTGVNKHLKDSVKTMTPIILLRNCGYEDRDLPLGDNSIRETRSISTIIKVENRDDE